MCADRRHPRSTDDHDLTAQRGALAALGVDAGNVHVDHGSAGTDRARPGPREALAAVRDGDTLVVAELDRLTRPLPDARDIVDELTGKGAALSLGGSIHNSTDPTDPVDRLPLNGLGMMAELHLQFETETDPIRTHTRECMAVAKAKGGPVKRPPPTAAIHRYRALTRRPGRETARRSEMPERNAVTRRGNGTPRGSDES